MTKIGIVVGSVREGRVGDQIGNWILEQARAAHPEAEFTVIDLKDYDLPMFDGPVAPMVLGGKYDNDTVAAWAKALDEQDGFIFVTSEYNHTIPGAFKNAVDSISPELIGKAVAFVGSSWDGAIRAVEQWRTLSAQFDMYDIRAQLALTFPMDFEGTDTFAPNERRTGELEALLSRLIEVSAKLAA